MNARYDERRANEISLTYVNNVSPKSDGFLGGSSSRNGAFGQPVETGFRLPRQPGFGGAFGQGIQQVLVTFEPGQLPAMWAP